jgi:hypothetical protein
MVRCFAFHYPIHLSLGGLHLHQTRLTFGLVEKWTDREGLELGDKDDPTPMLHALEFTCTQDPHQRLPGFEHYLNYLRAAVTDLCGMGYIASGSSQYTLGEQASYRHRKYSSPICDILDCDIYVKPPPGEVANCAATLRRRVSP